MSEQAVEPRAGVVVLTNENVEAFIDSKIAETAPPVEEKQEEVKTEEVKTEAKTEEKVEEKKNDDDVVVKKTNKELRGIEKRMHELVEDRKTAYAKAADEAAKREAAEAKARELELKYNPPKTPAGEKPKPEQYKTIEEYAEALETHTKAEAEKAVREEFKTKEQEKSENERVARFKERFEEGKKSIPAYDEVMAKTDVKVSNELRAAIEDSDNPAALLHYLATEEGEAARLHGLTVGGMLREVGKLEVKLAKPAAKSEGDTTLAEISKAPRPISTLKGGNAGNVVVDAKSDVQLPYAEYKAKRAAGLIK